MDKLTKMRILLAIRKKNRNQTHFCVLKSKKKSIRDKLRQFKSKDNHFHVSQSWLLIFSAIRIPMMKKYPFPMNNQQECKQDKSSNLKQKHMESSKSI